MRLMNVACHMGRALSCGTRKMRIWHVVYSSFVSVSLLCATSSPFAGILLLDWYQGEVFVRHLKKSLSSDTKKRCHMLGTVDNSS